MTKKRIKVSSAKAKGRKLQQWVARKVGELLNLPYGKDEIVESRPMGQGGTDIRLTGEARERFPWSIESKWQETWSIPSWIQQAKSNQMPDTNWLLICTKNRFDVVAVLDAEVFFDLLKQIEDNKNG